MSGKVALISLRYSPAFVQHGTAYAKALQELGFEPEFIVDSAYRTSLESVGAVRDMKEATLGTSWDYALFLNPSVKNVNLARNLKKANTRILYLFHEPWQLSLKYFESAGLIPTMRGITAHRVTVPILRMADLVILPSRYALRVYRDRDIRYNAGCTYLPLLFDDELCKDVKDLVREKRYVSYLGSLGRSHGFDQFMRFVRFALERDSNIRFLIASRDRLPGNILTDSLLKRYSDRVEIRCGSVLSMEEMNQGYAQSYCIWNLYRRSTQSGVLPKAFMFGTPVIAGKIGSFPEFIQEGLTGRFVAANDLEGIWNALTEIRQNIAGYAIRCRQSFLETFYYRAHIDRIAAIMREQRVK